MSRGEALSAASTNFQPLGFTRTVVLSLGKGDLHNGFPTITVQLREPGGIVDMQFVGSLPPAPEILELYRSWQLLYCALNQRLDGCYRLEVEAAGVTNVSEVEFEELCQRLSDKINVWFNSEQFRNIDQQLRTQLHPQEEIRFIIETNDNLLRRIPWHLWKFFEHYPLAEVALSTPEYQRPQTIITRNNHKIRILAILGNSKGINIAQDRVFLEQLSKQAKIEFLVEPQPEQLNDWLWQGWDILFFAGHSYSDEKGRIQLNQTDSLTLDQLKFALKKAISCGLKLAIFNSCDGLGLAQALCDLHIGQTIVMREPVPDVVAQEFLRHFLRAFSSGQSLYMAVRSARERLQKLEGKCPCATWLPVICQNPAAEPPSWQDLRPRKKQLGRSLHIQQPSLIWRHLHSLLILSAIVTALIVGVRHLGILPTWELRAFDRLMQLRQFETESQRLLIVAVYRDFSRPQDALTTRLPQDNRLFVACKVSAVEDDAPPSIFPSEIPKERFSFRPLPKLRFPGFSCALGEHKKQLNLLIEDLDSSFNENFF